MASLGLLNLPYLATGNLGLQAIGSRSLSLYIYIYIYIYRKKKEIGNGESRTFKFALSGDGKSWITGYWQQI